MGDSEGFLGKLDSSEFLGRNTITITKYCYQTDAGTVESAANNTLTFDWVPDGSDSKLADQVIRNANLNVGQIGSNTTSMDIDLDDSFSGDYSKLKLELYTLDSQAVETKVLELNSAAYIGEESRMGGPSNDTPYSVKVVTFSYDSGINALSGLNDNTQIFARLKYVDDSLHLDLSRNVGGNVWLVKHPPNPLVNGFLGTEAGDNGATYYKFKVQFRDTVDVADINSNMSKYLQVMNRNSQGGYDTTNILPDKIVASGNNVKDNYSDEATFYFSQAPAKDQQIRFKLIPDIFGNVMQNPVDSGLGIMTHIKTILKDYNGTILKNANIEMLPKDKLPQLNEAGQLDGTDFNQSSNGQYVSNLNSDKNGKIDVWVYPGQFYIYRIHTVGEDGRQQDCTADIDFNIPMLTSDNTFAPATIIPQNNVSGSVDRMGNNKLFKEKLLFLNTAYDTAYSHADGVQRDPNSDQSARDAANNDMSSLSRFYIKGVTTDSTGAFTLNLQPGTYELLGKDIGQGTPLAPLQTVTVIVPASGSVTVTGIQFAPPTVVGTLVDDQGNPLQNYYVNISGRSNGKWYTVRTDETGYFQAIINDAGIYDIVSAGTDWASGGAGRYYIISNQEFTLTADSKGKVIYQDISTIAMAATNTTINLKVDGSDIAKGDCFNAIRLNTPHSGWAEIPTNTDKIEMLLPDTTGEEYYSISGLSVNGRWLNNYTSKDFVKSGDVSMNVDLSDMFNAYVQLSDENGKALVGYRVDVRYLEDNRGDSAYTNVDGKAYFNLDVPNTHVNDNKNFQVMGYTLSGNWMSLDSLNKCFEVRTDLTPGNKASCAITILKPNFSGIVYNGNLDNNGHPVDGAALVQDGTLNITKLDGDSSAGTSTGTNNYFGFRVAEDGQFAGTLDQARPIYSSWRVRQ